MTNEPAERLRGQISKIIALPGMSIAEGKLFWENLDAALAAERRATVERIRAALRSFGWTDEHLTDLDAFLDAEAQR